MDNPFKNLPKPVLYGGIASATAVTGYLLYRHHKSTGQWFGGTATGTSTASAIDPITGLPTSQDNVVDPVTGETYLAEATQYGSVAAAEASVSSFGTTENSGTGSSTQFGTDGTTSLAPGAVGANTYTSNAAWDQAAIAGLEDISGGSSYNGTDIATALGDILQGEPVTAAQIQVWNAAVGEFGPPPSPVTPILAPITTPSTTTTGTSPSTPTGTESVTVPNVIGEKAENAQPKITAAGLKSTLSGPAFKTGTAAYREIEFMNPQSGKSVARGTNVVLGYKIVNG